ncbi:MAG TPA: L,D-transpeptidase family protein [Steroidobacteraceae bacterium]|nr:L,D-transpeptidase family protein [Steroidobacteraceae bacterium]
MRHKLHGTPRRLLAWHLWLALAIPGAHAAHAATAWQAAAWQAAARQPLPGRTVMHEQALLRALYALHPLPLWSRDGHLSQQGGQLADTLVAAGDYGLEPADYAADLIAARRRLLQSGGERAAAAWMRFDVMLSCAAIRLVTHLHYGRIDPRTAGFELAGTRNDLDVVATVAALAAAASVRAALAAVEPPFYHYRLLEAARARYRALQKIPGLTDLPALPRRPLRTGEAYAGAAALRRLLTALGDLPAAIPSSSAAAPAAPGGIIDGDLAAALQRFQARHGLTVDGSLGPQTYAALTTPIAQRVRQIDLTLERWRWLPPFRRPPIIVNIPEFRLFAFPTTDDHVAGMLQMDVIVGQTYPRTRTPIFVGELQYIVFRPYWNVPRSITLREMLPAIRAHADYLRRNDLQIVRGQSDDAAVVAPSPAAIDELAAGRLRLRLRQTPGEDNALGLVKFIFPNVHDVYMHGTPAHHLFLQSRRAFSHGCIRVSDPEALAQFVLRNAAGRWDDRQIFAAMHGRDSLRIRLPAPVPVMILYGTVVATQAGPVQFFDDIYGHDRKLAALLGFADANR